MLLGSHLSIAGGVHKALLAAEALGIECVQVFTANQRTWSPKPLDRADIDLWHHHRQRLNMRHVISHNSYLINLASPDDAAWKRSLDAFEAEWERCRALEIPWLVFHPGSHVGTGEATGIKRIIEALDYFQQCHPEHPTTLCLENTAGQGSSLGRSLEELRSIISGCRQPERLGVCLDTAHLLAAGYDLESGPGVERTLEEVDKVLGFDRIKVIHINDSLTPRGSRVDRHAHIGHGHIPLKAFATWLNHAPFARVPMILETEKTDHPDGGTWDQVNLATLRKLKSPGRGFRRQPARHK
ncbi:MAG: deoxyribonuclease IV [Phycisphaeraceae bacterium]|nr:deoxyribonuclease IV [Phycisphaeraceae bacterium]